MSEVLKDLARVKAIFQLRAITAAMGIKPEQIQENTWEQGTKNQPLIGQIKVIRKEGGVV